MLSLAKMVSVANAFEISDVQEDEIEVSLANCYFPMIPQDSPSCYGSAMRNLLALFIHRIFSSLADEEPVGEKSLKFGRDSEIFLR